MNGRTLPPRYPPGFSVLFLSPIYYFAPGQIGNGIYAVLGMGLIATWLAYRIGRRLAGALGGVLSAVLLLHHGQFAGYTQVIMTDVPAVALGLLLVWCYLRLGESGDRKWFALAGLAGGLSIAIRPLTGLLLLPFLIDAILNHRRAFIRVLLMLTVPAMIVIAGTAYQQWRAFGDAHRTGYQFWLAVPYDYLHLTFSPRYVHDNLAIVHLNMVWQPLALGLLGTLALLSRKSSGAGRIIMFIMLAAVPLSIIHLFYFFTDVRFHLLLLSLGCIAGGAGIAAVIPGNCRNRVALIAPVLALLILLPRIGSHPLEEYEPIRYAVATRAAQLLPNDAILISAIDPAYLEQIVARGTSRKIIPLDRQTPYAAAILTPHRIPQLDPRPRNAADHSCAGLLNGGAERLYATTADEEVDTLADWIRQGRPIYAELRSTERDLPRQQSLRAHFRLSPVSIDTPWLVRLEAIDSQNADH